MGRHSDALGASSASGGGGGGVPVWPGGYTCGEKGHGVYDAYSITPDHCDRSNNCDPSKDLNSPIIYNSCTMICMLSGFHSIAEKHGMKFGGSCFDNNAVDTAHFGTGPVCPGATFESADKGPVGIQMFTYKCTGGSVVDYGGPYK